MEEAGEAGGGSVWETPVNENISKTATKAMLHGGDGLPTGRPNRCGNLPAREATIT
jgi:hypothetical protein